MSDYQELDDIFNRIVYTHKLSKLVTGAQEVRISDDIILQTVLGMNNTSVLSISSTGFNGTSVFILSSNTRVIDISYNNISTDKDKLFSTMTVLDSDTITVSYDCDLTLAYDIKGFIRDNSTESIFQNSLMYNALDMKCIYLTNKMNEYCKNNDLYFLCSQIANINAQWDAIQEAYETLKDKME